MGRPSVASHRRRPRVLYLLMCGAVIGVVLALAACGSGGSSSSSASSAPTANVLAIADTGAITTWDPRASSSSESRILANFYEPLIWANPPGSAEPYSPALATSWETSAGGTVWTFKLRQGVTFHDGTPFNAQAVKYSFDATKKLGLGLAYIWADLKQVKVVDPYTVQLILDRPVPLEPLVSSEYAAWIFSPKTAGKPQSWWDKGREDGTGPYELQSYSPNQQIVIVRDPSYWGGWKNNQFRKVVFQVAADPNTQRQMLESGAVQFQESVSRDSVQAMQAEQGIRVVEMPSLVSQILYLNTQHKPLNNVLVRQALAYATPYQDIIAAAINNLGTQSNGPMPRRTVAARRQHPALHLRHRQGQAADGPGRLSERRVQAADDLPDRGEPRRHDDGDAAQGVVGEDRCDPEPAADALGAGVAEGQGARTAPGRMSCRSAGGRPTPTARTASPKSSTRSPRPSST